MRKLINKKNIRIITNSIVLALEGAKYKNFKIILLGGDVDFEYQLVYGTLTLSQLDKYYADKFIMSADGVAAKGGITTYYDQEADLCRKMIEHSKSTIAALNYTKVGRVTLKKFADIRDIDCLVTNENASKSSLSELKDSGLKTVLTK